MAVLTLESLPLGFRFHPTDEELVNYYLRSKINGNDSDIRVIPEVDVCKCEPWDLPGYSVIKSDDSEWFFFSPRDRKYPNGKRSNRATEAGYWKATGKDRSIKARKSGMNLIGMKKTLVFYKGRAPNGERTNWIIHEYRATHKDLQGTKTGQGAFVLCRLFKKADGKTENSSFDEVEPTGSSPATTKSSPVGTPTHLAFTQATPESDMQAGQQLTGIENWFSNSMTSDAQVPLDSWSDCFLASDVEDHGAEVTATKVDPQLEEDLRFFYEPTLDSLDCKVFSPLQSQRYTCQEPLFVDTPFADDFGYDNTEALFKDTTSEQDISISEFLNTVLNNQDEYILEESTCQKNSAVKSEILICTGIWQPPFESDPELDAARRFNGHVQTALESSRTRATFYGGECKMHAIGTFHDDSIGSATDPSFDVFGSLEEPTSWKNPVNKSDDHDETGIEIRTHQPQYQSSSPNIVAQGTAERRIRLQRELNSGMTRELNCSMEDHEAKLTVSFIKAGKATGCTSTSEPQMEAFVLDSDNCKEIARESSTRLRLRSRRDNVKCIDRQGSTVLPEASSLHHRLHFSSVYMVCVALAIIMFMLFVAVWRCLKY